MAAGQGHPYFPPDAVVPGYAPNQHPLLVILGGFGGIIGAFVLACVTLARWHNPALKREDQLTVAWFALCELTLIQLRVPISCQGDTNQYMTLGGFLHIFFEGISKSPTP